MSEKNIRSAMNTMSTAYMSLVPMQTENII